MAMLNNQMVCMVTLWLTIRDAYFLCQELHWEKIINNQH